MRIQIELPRDRDRCGRLLLIDDRSRVILGPVWCAGRATDAAAAGYGNDGRSYLLPYGDTPPGSYKIKKFISMRGASPRAVSQFGRFGVISLAAIDGPAVIADSVGRFEIWIHGGSRDPGDQLRPTNGSLRMADEDLLRLINLLKGREGLRVNVDETQDTFDAPFVGLDDSFAEGDPPVLDHIRLPPNRPSTPLPPTAPPAPPLMIFAGEYDPVTPEPPDQEQEPEQPGQPGQPGDSGQPQQQAGPGQPQQPDDPQQPDQPDDPEEPDKGDQEDGSDRGFTDYVRDKASDWVEEAPSKYLTNMNTGIINSLNDNLVRSGQSPLVLDTANAFRDDVTKAVSPIADTLGLQVHDNLQLAVKEASPDAFKNKTPSEDPPQTNYNLNLGVGVFAASASGHSLSDFTRLGSYEASISPLTTDFNRVTFDASANSANYSGQFYTVMTLSNAAGSLHFKNVTIGASLGIKFK